MIKSVRNFIITFLIALAVFGFSAYFVTNLILDCVGPIIGIKGTEKPTETGETQNPGNSVNDPDEISGYSFGMLVIGTDYQPSLFTDYEPNDVAGYPTYNSRPSEQGITPMTYRHINADAMMLIRVSKENQQYTFTYLPPNMKVQTKGVYMTLNEIYTELGVDYLMTQVTALTGFSVDYYAVVEMNCVSAMIDKIGGINFTVPVDMVYSDPAQNLNINIKAGTKKLNGDEALKILRFNRYTGKDVGRESTTVGLLKTVAAKLTSQIYYSQVGELYKTASNYVHTNFTAADLSFNLELIFKYSEYSVIELSYPGTYEDNGDAVYFIPNTEKALSILAKYR